MPDVLTEEVKLPRTAELAEWIHDFERVPDYRRFKLSELRRKLADFQCQTLLWTAQQFNQHWLFALTCHHEKRQDTATCSCGWTSDLEPNVGAAVRAWVEHVLVLGRVQGVR